MEQTWNNIKMGIPKLMKIQRSRFTPNEDLLLKSLVFNAIKK
jgi:hypothetical protein